MAAGYFGVSDPNSPAIWAEIQFTGWMIDGGVLMIALYLRRARRPRRWRSGASRSPTGTRGSRVCAAVILAANLGPAAMIFSFTPFVTQIGIQYWFLAGALHGVACRYGVAPTHDALG